MLRDVVKIILKIIWYLVVGTDISVYFGFNFAKISDFEVFRIDFLVLLFFDETFVDIISEKFANPSSTDHVLDEKAICLVGVISNSFWWNFVSSPAVLCSFMEIRASKISSTDFENISRDESNLDREILEILPFLSPTT